MDRRLSARLAKGFRTVACLVVAAPCLAVSPAAAHFPNYANMPVHPRVDVIPPLGNRLPSYRRTYNRPTYVGGRIAYLIAPSSQEAMSWHRSDHRGYYENHSPRREDLYFYPKPWEVLTVGPRVPVDANAESVDSGSYAPRRQSDYDAGSLQLAPAIEMVPAPQR